MFLRNIFASLRFVALMLTLGVGFIVIFGSFLCGRALGQVSSRFLYRLLCRIAGLRCVYRGKQAKSAVLFVANHVSYFDILILGGFLRIAFISKTEVRRWPLIGYVAKKMGTFFISRTQRALLKELVLLKRSFLKNEQPFLLFAEGTSGDGVSLYSFKQAFFQVIPFQDEQEYLIQPISLRTSRLNGLPARGIFKKFYSWRGDVALVPHLWEMCKLGRFDIEIMFHKPVSTRTAPSRNEMANALWDTMSMGEASLNA